MSQKINVSQLKKAAKHIQAEVFSSSNTLGYNQILQILCQGLFSKPFEEIKATSQNVAVRSEASPDILFYICYGDLSVLYFKGKIVEYSAYPFEDSEELKLQESLNCKLRKIELPLLIDPTLLNNKNIVSFAKKIGAFKYEKTIFDCLDDAKKVFINGLHSPFILDGDWFNTVQSEYDYDSIIWSAETERKFDLFEYYFSFNELCKAKFNGEKWIVGKNSIEIY